jgi:hypothetical protein
MLKDAVQITLTKFEAIALMSFLMRFRDDDVLAIEHRADEQILYDLCALVQNHLASEMTSENWHELLRESQAAVLDMNIG